MSSDIREGDAWHDPFYQCGRPAPSSQSCSGRASGFTSHGVRATTHRLAGGSRSWWGKATCMLPGGHEVDGRPIVPFEPQAMERAAHDIKARAALRMWPSRRSFPESTHPWNARPRRSCSNVVPDATVTLSCDIGRLGLLERENATVMNACLRRLGRATVQALSPGVGHCGAARPTVSDSKRRHVDERSLCRTIPRADLRLWTNQQYAWGSIFNGVSRMPWSSTLAVRQRDVGALVKGFPRPSVTGGGGRGCAPTSACQTSIPSVSAVAVLSPPSRCALARRCRLSS